MSKKTQTRLKLPTMYDVAKLAGVSQPTVSRVLNQNYTTVQISDDTRQRVMDAVDQLGYRPNALARSLRTQRTQTVALLIADITNGFYHVITRAIQDVARQHDYEVLISNSDHIYENEKHFCDVVSRRPVDGMMMVPIHLTAEDIHTYFGSMGTPVTILGSHLIDYDYADVVYVDDERATYEGVNWMIRERGYDSIGFVGVTDDLPPGPRRFNGFMRAMNECGLTLDPRFHLTGDFSMDSGAAAARQLIAVGELPRAIFVVNDLMAVGFMLTLQDAGYRVPEDIAVMGFDDIPEARILRPMLTTIAQDPRDIGLKMATAMFERIENPGITFSRRLESPYELRVRGSA